MRNVLVVLSGPSGVGKGTVARKLIERNPSLSLSISCTTRNPRPNEIDGSHYFFISKDKFESTIKEDGFLEYSQHFENYYGTPKKFVFEKLKEKDVLLEIDVNGGLKVKEKFPEVVLIMLLPPSIEEIYNRLVKRHTETLDKIKLRMDRIDYEINQADLYDYSVVNDDLFTAVKKIENIILNEKKRLL